MGFYPFTVFNKKFGSKLYAVFTLVLFISACGFTAIFFQHQRNAVTDTLIQNGKLLCGVLAHSTKVGVFSENEALLKDPIEALFQQNGVLEVSAFNARGQVLMQRSRHENSGGREHTGSPAGDGPSDIFQRLRSGPSSLVLHADKVLVFWATVHSGARFSGTESLFFRQPPSEQNDRVIGFVRVTLDKSIISSQLFSLLLKSSLVGLMVLILGSVILYYSLGRITKPLDHLTEAVKGFARQGTLAPIPVETEDEIGRLARAFNDMSDSLKVREAKNQQLEIQLRQSQKIEAIGTLAGGIAHDFNNILGVIVGYAELALLDVPDKTPLKLQLDQIFQASLRARDLIQQILTFSRRSEQERRPVQLDVITREVLKMLRASLPATIEIESQICSHLDPVLADPTQIHQVLMNLCTNAAHATENHHGTLSVGLSSVAIEADTSQQFGDLQAGRYQRLSVRDQGHGMEPEVIARIFDPFFTTKRPGKGTGMGLAVVHGIVKSHGGEIVVHSEVGKGSQFEVFFPVIDGHPLPASNHDEPLPKGTERILFIDDDISVARMGREMMESLGYSVVLRTGSREGLDIFRTRPEEFDLVISDMTMPQMTGLELAREIIGLRPNMPIILCTGFSDSISEEQIAAIGIQKLLMKPIFRSKLARTIRQVLDPV